MKKHPNATYSQFPDAAYKHSNMDPSLSIVLDLLNSPSQLAHKVGSYTGCNILYGDGSVLFRRSSELRANYGTGGSGNLIDGGNAIKWREILKALE
jgi:prepilin-type processing-associated H-X9-DG protein